MTCLSIIFEITRKNQNLFVLDPFTLYIGIFDDRWLAENQLGKIIPAAVTMYEANYNTINQTCSVLHGLKILHMGNLSSTEFLWHCKAHCNVSLFWHFLHQTADKILLKNTTRSLMSTESKFFCQINPKNARFICSTQIKSSMLGWNLVRTTMVNEDGMRVQSCMTAKDVGEMNVHEYTKILSQGDSWPAEVEHMSKDCSCF